jgi:serine phosphatase RsbU (regulator of sigma subunit)
LIYASAGHPFGHLLNEAGQVAHELPSTGPPLGIVEEFSYTSSPAIQISPGNILMLLSDGVIDALAYQDIDLGMARAVQYVAAHTQRSAAAISEGLCNSALQLVTKQEHRDDVTSIIVKAVRDL